MGLCHEFGSQIRAGCDHPMRAGASACSCAECGVVCRGLFDGCPAVWERGPRPVTITASRAAGTNGAPQDHGVPNSRAEGAQVIRISAPPAAIGPAPADDPRDKRSDDDDLRPGGRRRAAEAPRFAPGHRLGGDRAGADHRAGADDDQSARNEPGRDAAGDPRQEVFRWFEVAFEGVRGELQALLGSMTHQQAMLAELLDSRQAELRLALVAESLPDLVAEAVRSAMDEHTKAMAQSFDRSHDRFREDADGIRAATAATVESLHDSFEKLSSAIAVHDEEAEQREAVRLGVLKGSVTRQFTPLGEALADLGARIDALAGRVGSTGRSATAWAPPSAGAPASPAAEAPAPAATKVVLPRKPAAKRSDPPAAKRVSTPRMNRAAVADDPPPAAARRVATSRVAAAPQPSNGTAEPGARRVPTPRVATPRVAPARVAPAPVEPARVAPARVATGRAGTARVAASKAGDAGPPAPAEPAEPQRVPRVITRRRPVPASSPEEPLTAYELESHDDDDADEAQWSPPAWVSAAAARRAAGTSATRGRTPR